MFDLLLWRPFFLFSSYFGCLLFVLQPFRFHIVFFRLIFFILGEKKYDPIFKKVIHFILTQKQEIDIDPLIINKNQTIKQKLVSKQANKDKIQIPEKNVKTIEIATKTRESERETEETRTEKEKTIIVVCFGAFNPPHPNHLKLIQNSTLYFEKKYLEKKNKKLKINYFFIPSPQSYIDSKKPNFQFSFCERIDLLFKRQNELTNNIFSADIFIYSISHCITIQLLRKYFLNSQIFVALG